MASTARRPATSAPGDASRTITLRDSQPVPENNPSNTPDTSILRLRGGPRSRPRVMWDAGVIDNEGCNRKKSKICCIYHKPRRFDESSSESSSDESDSSCGSNDSRKRSHNHPHNRGDQSNTSHPNGGSSSTFHADPGPNAYEKSSSSSKGKRKGALQPLTINNRGETTGNEPLNVTILDSSFNPPTIAHAALASASRVEPALAHLVASPRLLLLSLTNPDKILKAGDATPAQRLEMMAILADELATGANAGSIAVGVTNAPTFVEKSVILREQFETMNQGQKVQLTFLMGWDTIVRVFASRYYSSSEAMIEQLGKFFGPDGSTVLCARRGELDDASQETEFLNLPYVAPFFNQGKIALVDLDRSVRNISSSGVRAGTVEDAEKTCPRGVVDYVREHDLYFWKKGT
ncbi:Cytidylyltransferase [Ceratobasidium theobromae]|uniref:Cytidylyltransferase n=1 Tax=Ceratobasidium theobromae TaxID=1582974 RepID=A0A5N5QTC7_9AGAM|nr:Cytidylyltransferase [Ceratobasidium theobromae]